MQPPGARRGSLPPSLACAQRLGAVQHLTDLLRGGGLKDKGRIKDRAGVFLVIGNYLLRFDQAAEVISGLRQQMRELVFSKARESGLPVLLVTHDEADAQAAGGPIVRIGV